jgi:hypothetical protein
VKVSITWETIGIIILGIFFTFMFFGGELICSLAKSEAYAYEQCTNDPECYMNYADYRDYYNTEEMMEKYCD